MANLTAEGAALLKLDIGYNTLDGSFYLLEDTGLLAGLEVGGENISFSAGLGPFFLTIQNKELQNPEPDDISRIGLTVAAGIELNFGAITSEMFGGFDAALLDVSGPILIGGQAIGTAVKGAVGDGDDVVSGSVEGRLPVFFPNDGNHIGDILIGETFGDMTDNGMDDSGFGDLSNIDDIVLNTETTPVPPISAGALVIDISEIFGFFETFNFDNLSIFDNILLAVDGLDFLLETLQDLFDSDIGSFSFPVIGDEFGAAATFLQTVRDSAIGPLRQAIESAENVAQDFADQNNNVISKFLFELLGPAGLDVLVKHASIIDTNNTTADFAAAVPLSVGDAILVDTNYDRFLFGPPEGDTNPDTELEDTFITWTLQLGDLFELLNAGIGFDLGIPGLGIETSGDVEIVAWWTLDLVFGLSYKDGFFLEVRNDDGADAELMFNLDVTMPGAEITGTLGFLQITAEDKTINVNDQDYNTGLHAEFAVDMFTTGLPVVNGITRVPFTQLSSLDFDYEIDAQASAALGLELGLSEDLLEEIFGSPTAASGFPTVRSDFIFIWEFEGSQGSFVDAVADGLRLVAFENITLDLGEFLGGVLGPIVNEVSKVTDPIQPLIDIFTTPLQPMAALGLDVTLLDLAGLFGDVDTGMIESIAEIITLINKIAALSDVRGVMLPIADMFIIYNDGIWGNEPEFVPDLTDANLDLGGVFSDIQQASGLIEFAAGFVAGIDSGDFSGYIDDALSGLDSEQQASASTFSSVVGLQGESGFAFPIFENPFEVLGLLMGKDATLITFDLAPLVVDFKWSQFFSIFGPLGVSVNLQVGALFDFAFGFDTNGIRRFIEGGFENAILIGDGFFISDTENADGSGLDVPEIVLTGAAFAAAELNLGIAKAGVAGGLFIEILFDLFDPNGDGKVRITELIANFENEVIHGEPFLAPLAIFDVSGEIFARLFAFLNIDFGFFEINKEFPILDRLTIIDFEIDFARPPILATEQANGDLTINSGKNAELRTLGITNDVDENFTITKGATAGGIINIQVTTDGKLGEDSDFILDYEMKVGGTLYIDGGKGNDTFLLKGFDDDEVFVVFDGGEGNDSLEFENSTGGVTTAFNVLDGGAGDDTIIGSGGRDLIIGGLGDDSLTGGGEDDLILGDGGELTNTTVTVTIKGTDGGDTLAGGDGRDIIIGAGGLDDISGNGDKDLLIGDGATLFFGSLQIYDNVLSLGKGGVTKTETLSSNFGDIISGGDDDDVIFGGNGGDVIEGNGGNDLIFGGFGPDNIDGGTEDDTIFGDNGVVLGNSGDKFGTVGPVAPTDLLLPGDGGDADVILGGLGEDLIFAGAGADTVDGDIGDPDPGDPEVGDPDEIHGGAGPDILRGNGGNDTIFGEGQGDDIEGGSGDDALDGGAGGDFVKGGAGTDTITTTKGNDYVDGGAGGDSVFTRFQGGNAGTLMSVFDTGAVGDGVDRIFILGTVFDDEILIRANTDGANAFVANINELGAVERINYTGALEQVIIDASLGNDFVAIDDTAASLVIDGNLGDDRFQIGQMFRTQRDQMANVANSDIFLTIETTRGWLSNGISHPVTIEGSLGKDQFTVFHNKAVLTLNGGDGDDIFEVRAFALIGSQEPQRQRTDISGGAGADLVQYAVNAPVNIDGGDGFDTLIVIGTEFGDDFVITESGVFGAGLNVNFVNIESLRVDGAEGNDRFFIQSTSEKVITEVFGGLGEDTFNLSGDTPPVVSNDLLGHSGLILSDIDQDLTTDSRFVTQDLFGISTNVADNEEPFVVIRATGGSTIVTEGSTEADSYEVVLTRRPDTDVIITALAPIPTGTKRELGAFAFRLFSDHPDANGTEDGSALQLKFTELNWFIPQRSLCPQATIPVSLVTPVLSTTRQALWISAAYSYGRRSKALICPYSI